MRKLMFPKKVWEPGDVDESGKQLWYSRPTTPQDTKRREELEQRWQFKRWW